MSAAERPLILEIEEFLVKWPVTDSPSRFGREVVRDPAFVYDLRAGRVPRKSTVARVREFMRTQLENQ